MIKRIHWEKHLDDIQPISNIETLPNYGFVFFFQNCRGFLLPFLFVTAVRSATILFEFATVYILGKVITELSALDTASVFTFYLPCFVALKILNELCGYILRLHGEELPVVYGDHLKLRMYRTLSELPFSGLQNYSPEKLSRLTNRYITSVVDFLSQWVWSTTSHLIQFFIIIGILLMQSPLVFVANLVYISLFLALALYIARKYAPIAKEYSEKHLELGTSADRAFLNIAPIQRLAVIDYIGSVLEDRSRESWESLRRVRLFHAGRWFLQLNLFNFIYALTLFYGAYQVIEGNLELGFLVLIKFAFDRLWAILVYVIEYYVKLIKNAEDTKIAKGEFATLKPYSNIQTPEIKKTDWKSLCYSNIQTTVQGREKSFSLSAPELLITRGDKIGIRGPSGAGKTLLLNILLGLQKAKGRIEIDGDPFESLSLPLDQVTLINTTDPLFYLSLEDNIFLGRKRCYERDTALLHGLEIDDFVKDYKMQVGGASFHLSTGQEQRIRLARGLVQDRSLLLLDEAFNGIDPARKKRIISFLKAYLSNKTVLLVSHHEEDFELVDTIYEINEGKLSGPRERENG